MSLKKEFEYYFNELDTNLCSFKRDYKNVDIFYSCIEPSQRISNKEKLLTECYKVTNNNFYKTSPDFGGCLCVIGYNDENVNLKYFENKVKEYIQTCDKNNPHNLRWCISLSYLLGELKNDIKWYYECISYDWRLFNTLILTKNLSARYKIAQYEIKKRNETKAYSILTEGVELYKEGLRLNQDKTIGKNGTYIVFSLMEISDLSKIALSLVDLLNNMGRK